MEYEKPSAQLQCYLLIAKRRWLPASLAFGLVCVLSAIGLSFKKPVYVAEGKLKFERVNPTSSITGLGKESGTLQPLVDKSNPLTTEAEIIRSLPIASQTIDALQLHNPDSTLITPSELVENLNVASVRETDILVVSYPASNPAEAASIVNTLMKVYLEHNIRSHRAQAIAARKFLEQQLPKNEEAVHEAEKNLQQFKEKNQIISLSEEATSAVETLTELRKQIATAQAQMDDASTQATSYQNQLGTDARQAKVLVSLSQSPGVQTALSQIQQLEADLASQRSSLQPMHPKILDLETRLANLRELLQQRSMEVTGSQTSVPGSNLQVGKLQQDITQSVIQLNSQSNGLRQQVERLSSVEKAYRDRASQLPMLEKEQRELERKVEATQSSYSQLLQKMSEVQMAEGQNTGNAQIIVAAQPPNQSTSTTASFFAAGLLGLLVAGATVYALEVFDRTIKTIEQAKQAFGFTVLAVIPQTAQGKSLVSLHLENARLDPPQSVEPESFSAVSSAYRILQTNLKFLSSKPLRVIVVSSSIPKEGKSTISANLAATIAQSGKRVLLIDADLYRPTQHQIWGISNEVGLSHLLVEEAAFRKAAKCVTSNLDVLTAGMTPPNTLALLDSQKMMRLIEQVAEDYDAVIIDTPPLNLATDALVLSKMANGIVMVIRPGLLNAGNVSFAKGLLEQSEQTVFGQVINGVVVKNEPHSHYYFSNSLHKDLYSKT